MADNVSVDEGADKAIAADDIASVWYQRVKPQVGGDGSAADVSETRPMPVIPGHPSTKILTNASIDIASSGDNTIVSATALQTTRVFRLVLVADSAVDVILKSGATALTGTIRLNAKGSIVLDFDGEPHFVTGANEAFIVNLSAAVSVDGWIQYEKSA